MLLRITLLLALTSVGAVDAAAYDVVDDARYSTAPPAEGWTAPGFDDSGWAEGKTGLGNYGVRGGRVNTEWLTEQVWVRKRIDLDAVPANPALMLHHDDDAEFYLNGKLAVERKDAVDRYVVLPISDEAAAALRAGENVLAMHCRNTGGAQHLDAHLVDADNPPELPPAKRRETPQATDLVTEWGAGVTAENAWTEYPRPQLRRDQWQNLNGMWDYALTPIDQTETPTAWDGEILVPFCLESKLGGVQELMYEDQALWYRRTFTPEGRGARTLLNFEAVDYECRVFVNGEPVGEHRGGNTPFAVDVTDALRDGPNELVLRVTDATEEWQLRGKQSRFPDGIWYTRVSGIWQTVWLERVADAYVEDLTIQTSAADGTITCTADVDGGIAGGKLTVVAKADGQAVAAATGKPGEPITLAIPGAKLWSPDSPFLYDLEVTLQGADGESLDRVDSYAGVRDVGKRQDADGHWRFTLNGEEIFHLGPLDQGWWPDGLLTPPSDEAMRWDIEYLKAAGFNMIRKHIKVEPRRYYYHCDKLGMMMWQDQVSGGRGPGWTHLRPNPKRGEWPAEPHRQFMAELEAMIDTLESHPSIVVWVPFNEAWGQHSSTEVGEWTSQRDPSRLVNVASGGNFWPVGDIADQHSYPHPSFPLEQERLNPFVKVVGEYGGHGLLVPGHAWDATRRNWGYGGLTKDTDELIERYVTSLEKLKELHEQGIAGAVYTQTTDVENELNGLVTYDRKVIKAPAKKLAELHKPLVQGAE